MFHSWSPILYIFCVKLILKIEPKPNNNKLKFKMKLIQALNCKTNQLIKYKMGAKRKQKFSNTSKNNDPE